MVVKDTLLLLLVAVVVNLTSATDVGNQVSLDDGDVEPPLVTPNNVLNSTVNKLFVDSNSESSDTSDRTPPITATSALSLCKLSCACSDEKKTIVCTSMRELWLVIEKTKDYQNQFEQFQVKVSDEDITEIGSSFTIFHEANGLIKVRKLILDDFPALTSISPIFFQKTFPNLHHLTITKGKNQLREVTVGRLPYLQELIISGKQISKVTGCEDDEHYCFDADSMEILHLPTLNLIHMGLPDDVTTIVIKSSKAENPQEGNEHMFDYKVVEYLNFTMDRDDLNFPPVFDKIVVNEEFNFELPHMDDEQMELIISDIHKNPSLYSRMRINVNKDDFLFPVYYKSCPDCDYDDIYNLLEKSAACSEEKNNLEKYNPDINDLNNKDITIRGIYIDIDDLIKTVKGFNQPTKYTLTVYTFVAKKPKFKTIDFHIRIYYAVLDGHSSLQQHIVLSEKQTSFSVQEMFGTALKYAKRLDPLFVLSYSTCIGKLATDFKNNSPTRRLQDSPIWQMFVNLPNTGIYSSTLDPLSNSKASALQQLLTKYMYMLAEDRETLNKIPYSSIEVQKERARALLKSADNILARKNNVSSHERLQDIQDQGAANIKGLLNAQDENEMLFLKSEQSKAMTLVDIATQEKETFEEELIEIEETLNAVKTSYVDTEVEFQSKSQTFIEGALDRHAATWADLATELSASIISLVTMGNFDLSDVTDSNTVTGKTLSKLNSAKKILREIMQSQKKLKKIGKIYKKIEKLFKARFDILKSNLREVKSDELEDRDIDLFPGLVNRFTEDIQTSKDVAESLLAYYKASKTSNSEESSPDIAAKHLLPTEEINIFNPGEQISSKEILQWDVLRNHVEKLLTNGVAIHIPESGEYKAALFNIITKGKAIAQLKLDQAKLMADIGFTDKSYWQHVEEYAAIGVSIQETSNAKNSRKIDYGADKAEREYDSYYNRMEKDMYADEFIIKLMIIEGRHIFCQNYYYYHLKRCPSKYNIDVYSSLPDAITSYRSLLLEPSIGDVYMSQNTQSFNNIAVFIRKEDRCQCVQRPYDLLKAIKGRRISIAEERKFRRESMANCFPDKPKPHTRKDYQNVFDKLDQCNMDRITRFSKENIISFDIPIHLMKSFDHYEHVRIEEIKVLLDGVKTTNGKVSMKIENSGMFQDRYKGEVFKFLGAPWIRNYEYCSKQTKLERSDIYDDVPTLCTSRHFKTLLSTNTDRERKWYYPRPTLFSTWIISVPKMDNVGLDLSNLKSIEINFSGRLDIGRSNYSSYDVYGNPPTPVPENH